MIDAPITYQQAMERLSEPGVNLNMLTEELEVVLAVLKTGRFPNADRCEGLVLWRDPENPDSRITFRNGIFNFVDGARHSADAKRLWQERVSHPMERAEISFGNIWGDGNPVIVPEVIAGLEEIVGSKLTSKVLLGWDNFYHFIFDRKFSYADRQRLIAENIVTFMNPYACMFGASRVIVSTGRIEVMCYLPKKEPA